MSHASRTTLAFRPTSQPRLTLFALATLFVLLYLLYGNRLYYATPESWQFIWRFTGPFIVLIDFVNPLYSHIAVFFSAIIGNLGLTGYALLRGQPGKIAKTILFLGSFLVVAAPLLLPAIYTQYEPYATPDSGWSMVWVTPPANRFTSAFKSAQRWHEVDGCDYTLLGWDVQNRLYFESSCLDTLWRYEAGSNGPAEAILMVPDAVIDADGVLRFEGGLYPPPPPGLQQMGIDRVLYEESAISPDGQFVAAAIRNYYGPRDVVVLTRNIDR